MFNSEALAAKNPQHQDSLKVAAIYKASCIYSIEIWIRIFRPNQFN
jgi:hypothetical protein